MIRRPTSGIRYSVLDLVPIRQGGSAEDALREARELVRLAERLGYHRYWVAEHHNIPGVASSATSVVIGHLAAATSSIRVGSGGIMLPNHPPLVIAEQFGTLASLFPGRIDLGLGRAPGGDRATAHALRRHAGLSADSFPQDVVELQRYLGDGEQLVRAVPGQGTHVPLYLLGSSTFSAQLAARLGLPFAFASHFAPDLLEEALALYRAQFEPSEQLDEPYVLIGVNVFAAETDEEAARLFTTLQQIFRNLVRGAPREMPPPVDRMDWSDFERVQVSRMTRCSVVGGPQTLRIGLQALVDATGADEIIATAPIYDFRARLRSYEIAAGVFPEIPAASVAQEAAVL